VSNFLPDDEDDEPQHRPQSLAIATAANYVSQSDSDREAICRSLSTTVIMESEIEENVNEDFSACGGFIPESTLENYQTQPLLPQRQLPENSLTVFGKSI
jgi:hypothetical protein